MKAQLGLIALLLALLLFAVVGFGIYFATRPSPAAEKKALDDAEREMRKKKDVERIKKASKDFEDWLKKED